MTLNGVMAVIINISNTTPKNAKQYILRGFAVTV